MKRHAELRALLPRLLACLFGGLVATTALAAPPPQGALSWCGSDDTTLALSIAHHLARERQRAQQRLEGVLSPSGPTITTSGNIALLEDDGSLLSSVSRFDLAGKSVEYQRSGARVIAAPSGAGVVSDLGERLELGDDATIELALPQRFRFAFYGQPYTSIFVASDGNVTFGQGDARQSRKLSDLINGPPRIAAFFADLDPSAATGDGGVYVRMLKTKVQITWWRVPEFGIANENTIQLTLKRNGKITVSYGEVAARQAVIGAAPGRGQLVELVDFTTELPFDPGELGIGERFSTSQEIDDLTVSTTFLRHFGDEHEFLVVFLDFPHTFANGTFAYALGVRNTIEGIGLNPAFDVSSFFGSSGRLESYAQMGSLSQYPADPAQVIGGFFSGLNALAHELGHRWLARARFDRGLGSSDELLGRQRAHWSFFMDSDGSVMEGNDLRDNGDGTFLTLAANARYSQLDLYLMGMISEHEVPPFFYVSNAQGAGRDNTPRAGVRLRGDRVDLTIAEIIAANGPRRPSSAEAPKHFKVAFVLIGRQGAPPSAASIAKVDLFRQRFVSHFNQITGGRGSLDTTLEVN